MRILVFTFLTLIFAGPAPAADPEVWNLDGQKITFDSEFARYAKENKTLRRLPVRIASENIRPLRQPKAGSDESGAAGIPFLEEVRLVGQSLEDFVQDQENYHLIARVGANNKTTLLGWVPKALVLKQDLCLRDTASKVTIKAMVVNSISFLSGASNAETKYSAPRVRLAPDPKAPDEGEFRFFDFYFVWADTDINNDKSGWALLGDRESYLGNGTVSTEEFRAKAKILGWVDKSRLCFWKTREAIQWDDLSYQDKPPRVRTKPAITYPTRKHALFAGKYDSEPPDSRLDGLPVNEDPFVGGKPIPWEGDRMRYPILTIPMGNGKEIANESWPGRNVLRKVGIIGDVYDESGRKIMTQAARKRIVDRIERARQELNRTEILFVIDRTRSMEQWWIKTADWAKRLIQEVKADGRSVKIGFCFYGDVHPGGAEEGKVANLKQAVDLGGVIPGRLLDIQDDSNLLDRKVKELADTRNPIKSGYREEMVYAGLEVGLIEAGWKGRENARQARKMLILIGDDGNHALSPDEEQKVLGRIAELFVPFKDDNPKYETPIEFYALQVCPIRADDPSSLFEKQARALVAKVKSRSPKYARADYFNAADDPEKFFAVINRRYAELTASIRELERDMAKAERGQIGSGSQFRIPEASRIMQDIASSENISVDMALKGIQAFEERWVWSLDVQTKESQTRRMILVSQAELDLLIGLLLKYRDDTQDYKPTLEDLAYMLVAFQSGDVSKGEARLTVEQVKERGKDFAGKEMDKIRDAFNSVSDVYTYLGWGGTPVDPQNRDPEALRKLQDDIALKLLRLEDVRAERVCQYSSVTGQKVKRMEGEVVDLKGAFKRGFQRIKSGASNLDGPAAREGAIWYWLDFEREWP